MLYCQKNVGMPKLGQLRIFFIYTILDVYHLIACMVICLIYVQTKSIIVQNLPWYYRSRFVFLCKTQSLLHFSIFFHAIFMFNVKLNFALYLLLGFLKINGDQILNFSEDISECVHSALNFWAMKIFLKMQTYIWSYSCPYLGIRFLAIPHYLSHFWVNCTEFFVGAQETIIYR